MRKRQNRDEMMKINDHANLLNLALGFQYVRQTINVQVTCTADSTHVVYTRFSLLMHILFFFLTKIHFMDFLFLVWNIGRKIKKKHRNNNWYIFNDYCEMLYILEKQKHWKNSKLEDNYSY